MHPEKSRVTVSRQDLYDQVWSTPMTKLAIQYGYSDVGLRKICIKYQIPTPSGGYWAQKQFGKAPEPTPLPECDDPKLQTITFIELEIEPRKEPEPIQLDSDLADALRKCQSMPKVQLADDYRKLHPNIRMTKDRLEAYKPDANGIKHSFNYDRSGVFQVDVSQACVKRAILILDALVKGLEALGATLVNDAKSQERSLWFELCNERVWSIRVRERVKRVPKKHDPTKLWDSQNALVPTGQLIIAREGFENEVCRDSPSGKKRIEDCLNEVLEKFVYAAADARATRLHQEERRKSEALRQHRIVDLQIAQSKEREKVTQLMELSEAWNKSQQLRKYINAYEDCVADRNGELSEQVQAYIDWAKAQADRMDPLRDSPHSILDERVR